MRYDLVFEGGAAKGMVFAGAVAELERAGHGFGRLLGTSAGSVTAALLASGAGSEGLLAALGEKKGGRSVFEGFMATPARFSEEELQRSALRGLLGELDLPLVSDAFEAKLDDAIVRALMSRPIFRSMFSFIELGGWYASHRVVEWMTERLDDGQVNGRRVKMGKFTLGEMFEETGVDLSIVATNTTHAELMILNHRTAPKVPVVSAVHMSMSIPLLWQEVVWRKEWGTYRDEDLTGATIIDGGVLSNFPLELFVSDEPQVTALMGRQESDDVLGLLIDEELPVPGLELSAAQEEPKGPDLGQRRTVDRLKRLIATVVKARDKLVIDAFEHLVVRLPAKGIGTTEFDLSDERRAVLTAAGKEAMRAHLARRAAAPPSAPDTLSLTAGKMAARLVQSRR
ncbi:patatin-like phospholipase family protein [Myxococcota bacterium]|nr:patatin-like phospholipase family protein [Myxococcota bacterium]